MKRFALLPLLLAFALDVAAQDTNDYVLRSDLAPYAERAELDSYATHSDLSNHPLTSDLTAYATLADLAGFVTSSNLANYALLSDLPATIAAYLATNPPTVSSAVLTNYALRSDLSAYAPLSALAGFLTSSNLSDYVLASDLAAYATASDLDGLATESSLTNYATLANLSAATNSFLPAEPRTSLGITDWYVQPKTVFEAGLETEGPLYVDGEALFSDPVEFDDAAYFAGPIDLGDFPLANWNDRASRTVEAGGSVTAAPNDHIIWTIPEGTNGVSIYLPDLTTTNSRTIIVRNFASLNNSTTTVHNVDGATTRSLSRGETAVFDWCPDWEGWYSR